MASFHFLEHGISNKKAAPISGGGPLTSASRFTFFRITLHASRITFLPHHASRITS
jgi:hypothetical protein